MPLLAIDIIENKKKYSEICKGKKLATLFFEPSTPPAFRLRLL
jgi:aspartate carbamoyltransferase catalytic subunit